MSLVLNLSAPLDAQLARAAAEEGLGREELASEILAQAMAERATRTGKLKARHSDPPLRVFDMGPMLIAPTNAAINELLEEEDLENYLRVLKQHD